MTNMAQIYALSKLFGGGSGGGGGGSTANLHLTVTNPDYGDLEQFFWINMPIDSDGIYNGEMFEGSSSEDISTVWELDIPIPMYIGESYLSYNVTDEGNVCTFSAAMTGNIEQSQDYPSDFRITGDCTLAITITGHA